MPCSTAMQLHGYSLQGVGDHRRPQVSSLLRRLAERRDLAEHSASRVTNAHHSGGIGPGTAATVARHVSAVSQGNAGHLDAPCEVGSTYSLGLPMSQVSNHKKLCPHLHLAGSLKVPLADALRRATKRMRNAAKEIARVVDRHENTAKNWLRAENEMSATELVRLMREFDEVADLVLNAAGLDASLVKLRALKSLLEE